jgi:hypothetical protein
MVRSWFLILAFDCLSRRQRSQKRLSCPAAFIINFGDLVVITNIIGNGPPVISYSRPRLPISQGKLSKTVYVSCSLYYQLWWLDGDYQSDRKWSTRDFLFSPSIAYLAEEARKRCTCPTVFIINFVDLVVITNMIGNDLPVCPHSRSRLPISQGKLTKRLYCSANFIFLSLVTWYHFF